MTMPKSAPPLEWVIVGGGIHGVHIGARLLGEGGVDPKSLAVVDPAATLLSQWRTRTARTGMTHLRSPMVHHLGHRPGELLSFAGPRKRTREKLFRPPYSRPALELFNAHCDKIVGDFDLSTCHVQGKVRRLEIGTSLTAVVLEDQTLMSRRVVLALGSHETLAWPSFCPQDDARIQHVFAPDFDEHVFTPQAKSEPAERVVVIGGGITAAQVALRAFATGRAVTIVARHAPRVHQFDSDPGWLGPKFLKAFDALSCHEKRRAMITKARHRGSLPPDVERDVRRASCSDRFSWLATDVETLEAKDELKMVLADGPTIAADRVVVATGFCTERPGGSLVDALVEDHQLECSPCGFPVVGPTLQWTPSLFVAGALAELQLGPAARNIAGARRAADKLVATARRQVARTAR